MWINWDIQALWMQRYIFFFKPHIESCENSLYHPCCRLFFVRIHFIGVLSFLFSYQKSVFFFEKFVMVDIFGSCSTSIR